MFDKIQAVLIRARAVLQGEPLRVIVYGATLVVWLVLGIANAVGITRFGPALDITDALTQATAAGVLLTEIVRRYVSPASP